MFSPKLFAHARSAGAQPRNPDSRATGATDAEPVSRRQFLTRGAALSGLTMASLAEATPISVERTPSGVVVHVDRVHWPIHAAAFGPHAVIDSHVKGSRALLRVRGARFEGTPLAYTLRLKIFESPRRIGPFDKPTWWLELEAGRLGYATRVPLFEWLREATEAAAELSAPALDRIARSLGLRHVEEGGTLGPRPDFQWHFNTSAELDETEGSFRCRSFRVSVDPPGHGAFDHVSDRALPQWSTRVTSETIEHRPNRFLTAGIFKSGSVCQLHPTGLKSVTVQWTAGLTPERVIGLTGSWRVRAAADTETYLGGFESESGSVYVGRRNGIRHLAAVLPLQEKTHAVQTDAGQVVVSGADPEHRVAVSAVGSEIKMAEATGLAHSASYRLPGADYSRLDLGGVQVSFAFDDGSVAADSDSNLKEASTSSDNKTLLVLASRRGQELPLDKAELTVLRADDLLSLKFRFQNLRLVSAGRGKPWRVLPVVGATSGPRSSKRPVLIAEFPPQHVMEQCYGVRLDPEHDLVNKTEDPPTTPFVEARLSGSSQLAFEVPLSVGKEPGGLDYSLDELTCWDVLPLVVSKVAEDYSTDGTPKNLASLLYDRDISQVADLKKRWSDVLDPLTKPLGCGETAIELPARLTISPTVPPRGDLTAQALFQTTIKAWKNEANATVVPLWQARLNVGPGPKDTRGIRAIHSPDLRVDLLEGNQAYSPDASVPWGGDLVDGKPRRVRFPTAAADRHQLVLLSSGVGLPTLPRLVPVTEKNGKPFAEAADPPRLSPTNFALDPKDPALKPYWVLDVGDGPQGVYVPPAMPVRELTLSSLGGTLDVTALFEPPASPHENYQAFDLEKWKQTTILGRDVVCDVDYKGFLFPLGHRCTWVRLTERYYLRNHLFGDHPLGGNFPTAYLVQRQFIVISRPDRNFPRIGHPYDARDFPAKMVSLRTTRTPDIVNMSEKTGTKDCHGIYPSGRIDLGPDVPDVIVAWPRVDLGPGNEVRFQVAIDGAPSNMTVPLIFVDNAAAHSSKTMGALVDWYMALPAQSGLRSAEHNGAARSYAPESTAGNTTFETKRWLLGARGRLDRDVDKYVMDAVMEGADQPPFYPYVVLSQLMVRSLQRFTGRTTSWIAASFEDSYSNNGFAPAQNPSEIYLNIHGYEGDDYAGPVTPVGIDLGGAGDRSGGVSKPSSQVVALSRSKGPVGGATAPSLPVMPPPCPPSGILVPAAPHLFVRNVNVRALANARPADAQPVVAPPAKNTTADYSKNPSTSASSALSGRFDPLEFFGGASGTILGLIPIKDVIKAALFASAPKLLESLNSAASAIDDKLKDQIQKLQTAFGGAADEIKKALDAIDAQIRNTLDPNTPPDKANPALSLRGFYPNLDSAARGLVTDLLAVQSTPPDVDHLDTLLNNFQKCLSGGNQIIQALEQIAANPTPAVLQDLLKWIAGLRDPLALLVTAYEAQLKDLWGQARFAITSDICKSADGLVWQLGLFNDGPTLLGGKEPPKACAYDWTDPSKVEGYFTDLATYAGEALFCEVLSRPLLDLLINAYQLIEDLRSGAAAKVSALTGRAVKLVNQFFDVVDRASVGPRLFADYAANQCATVVKYLMRASNDAQYALAADEVTLAKSVATAQAQLVQFATFESQTLQTIQVWSDKVQKFQEQAPADGTLKGVLDQLNRALASLKAAGATVTQARLAAAGALTRLSSAIDEFERQRKQLADEVAKLPQACEAIPLALFGAAGRVMSLRLRAITEVQTFSARIMDALSATNFSDPTNTQVPLAAPGGDLQTLAQELKQLQGDLLETLQSLFDNSHQLLQQGFRLIRDLTSLRLVTTTQAGKKVGFSQAIAEDVNAAKYAGDSVQKFTDGATKLWGRLNTDFTRLQNLKIKAQADVEQAIEIYHSLRPTFGDIVTFCGANERALVGLVGQSGAMLKFADALSTDLVKAVGFPVTFLANIYTKVLSALNSTDLKVLDDRNSVYSIALRLLVGQSDDSINLFSPSALSTALQSDLDLLNSITSKLTEAGGPIQQLNDALPLLKTLRDKIEKRELKLLVIADQFGKLIDAAANGQLISVSKITDGLKDTIKSILTKELPFTSVNVGYDLNTALRPVEPFFYMDEDATDPHLSLSFKAVVNLLNPSDRHVQVTGMLKSFRVDIVGVVTLHFEPVTFNAQDGQKPALNLKIRKVEIGAAAQFIQALQAWLSPGGGFYIHPQLYPPGIVAGFGIDCGTIGLGEVSFLNVAIGASMTLPFDDRPALFAANVSTRESPFLISVLPFGGGGFLSVISNAHSIVGFEASFEFGAVVAFGFGPLEGQGLVTTGIYIAKLYESVKLSGFFLASGSAHLACFGIAATLLISIEQGDDGDLNGNATFTFTFSMGFLDISYEVGVTRKIGKGFGNGGGGAVGDLRAPVGEVSIAAYSVQPVQEKPPTVKTTSPNMATDWPGYAACFDASL